LLPEGFAFSEELEAEDQFYRDDPHIYLGRAHELAHLRAREVVGRCCEAAGVGEDSWVLCIGTGGGNELRHVEPYSRNIVGIDISPCAMREFLTKNPYAGFVATADCMPFTTGSFDAVVCSGVLHHLAGSGLYAKCIAECLRVLKPGGALITAEPSQLYPVSMVMRFVDMIGQRIRPGWRHHVAHERPLIPLSLKASLRRAGFREVTIHGTSFCHNKFPYALSKQVDRFLTPLARKPFFRHFTYWFGCVAVK